uniref:Uncharacterized protein n=1 Tax=Psilocybe cubensis TaxID=181762 RepID=A0A8H8CJT9_PSICU
MPPKQSRRVIGSDGRIKCAWCTITTLPRGLAAHERSCSNNPANRNSDLAFDMLAVEQNREAHYALQIANGRYTGPGAISAREPGSNSNATVTMSLNFELLDRNILTEPERTYNETESDEPAGHHHPQLYDIKIKHHPRTNEKDQHYTFAEYCELDEADTSDIINQLSAAPPRSESQAHQLGQNSDSVSTNKSESESERPWRPFRTHLDFEFAEIFLSSHMSRDKIEVMISLIHRAIKSPRDFTLENNSDLSEIWGFARDTCAQGFIKAPIFVEYKGESLEYNVWYRPIWEWCRELLLNPALIREFRWDAEKIYMFNGNTYERVIDEPWTADEWWTQQSRPDVPHDASLLCIEFWADKANLSSFGTVKGYPVLVRCANLPVDIQNGSGVGGGRLIGWLPIPDEDSAHIHKSSYVDLKRLIWHKAVHRILKSIEDTTYFGAAIKCGDGLVRNIFPHVLMISADYEEQTMMALTRGKTGLFPCPICLVPQTELSNLLVTYPRRTTSTMQEVYNQAQQMNVTRGEEHLKSYGITDVPNVFWDLHRTDIYAALSFDVLHAYDGGLFKHHLLGELKATLRDMGRAAETAVDHALQSIPPWSGLNHFHSLQKTGEMADGRKFEDLSKVIVYACQHVLTPESSQSGYLLLQLTRSYLELRMFVSLTLQTETFINYGRGELIKFEKLLRWYEAANREKSWNFPKIHTHQHVFDDIFAKGVTQNYNTKPNEKANGPLKKYYQNHTNFKNTEGQILRVSEMDLVSTIIRSKIDDLDLSQEETITKAKNREGMDLEKSRLKSKPGNDHVEFGSRLPQITLENLENIHSTNVHFTSFRRQLGHALTRLLGTRIMLSSSHTITPYQTMEVFYRSLIDWRIESNILQTNPDFHHKKRYDFTLIKVEENKCIFVQLLYIFGIQLDGNQTLYMALVLPLDVPRSLSNRRRDKDLRLLRVKSRPSSSGTVFINTDSIIRGALLSENHTSDAVSEYFVNTLTDQDMWKRLNPDMDSPNDTELITHANI